ncbi:endonuclease III, partial [Candidatus Dependentiae bacterium]|nr:endonuclease III [Candidatus Dependentiae bacterium]
MKFDFNSFFLYSKVHTAQFVPTMSDVMVNTFGKDPFVLLMSCLISLRAKDRVTTGICQKLFSDAPTLESLRELPRSDLEKRLFSVGFYKVKAQTLHNVCDFLIERFQGKVPLTMEELLVIPGVGRKTANLVLGMAFDQPSICVDVHVHRIANELGWVKTKTPEETE